MALKHALILLTTILLLSTHTHPTHSKSTTTTQPSAPAPSPGYVNITNLLDLAGPFHTFLNYLTQTQVLTTIQTQANTTQGITLFIPSDEAFSSLKKPSISKLSNDKLKSLLLFHALPSFHTLDGFYNLSMTNPVTTMAGGAYKLNFSYVEGLVRVNSGWSNPKIASSVYSTEPVALYEVQKVLLPSAIFGEAPPPPPPAPAPAPPTHQKAADAPADIEGDAADSPSADSPSPNDAPRVVGFGGIVGSFLLLWCVVG